MKTTFSEAFTPCPEHQDWRYLPGRAERLPEVRVNRGGPGKPGSNQPCPKCKQLTNAAATVLALAAADKKSRIPMPKWSYQQGSHAADHRWWCAQLGTWMVGVAGWRSTNGHVAEKAMSQTRELVPSIR